MIIPEQFIKGFKEDFGNDNGSIGLVFNGDALLIDLEEEIVRLPEIRKMDLENPIFLGQYREPQLSCQ